MTDTSNTSSATTKPATNAPSLSGSLLGSFTPIMLMLLVFYFLIIRPQQKREAKNRELINSLKRGDKVVTTAGMIGIVHKIIGEQELSLEIAEGTRIRVLKNSIARVLSKDSELGNETPEEKKTSDVPNVKAKAAIKKSGSKMKK